MIKSTTTKLILLLHFFCICMAYCVMPQPTMIIHKPPNNVMLLKFRSRSFYIQQER